MPNLSLEDLQQRIHRRDTELLALRRQLQDRQNQLASLTSRQEELRAQLQRVEAEIAALTSGSKTVASTIAGPAPAAKKRPPSVRSSQPPLPLLLVTLLREAGRPLTARELAEEAKRRGFKSGSGNFVRLVETRTAELKRKGILRRAVGQPGFVVGRSTGARTNKTAVGPKARPGQQTARGRSANRGRPVSAQGKVPLREILTQILQKSSKPLTGSELAARALAAGYRSTSKNFVDVVWVAAGNIDNVENVPGQGYRLKKTRR
jgi:hypothetical protein